MSEETTQNAPYAYPNAVSGLIHRLPPAARIQAVLELLLVYSSENPGQFAGARVAIRDRLVAAVRTPFSQLLTRPTLTAAAVANPCKWVLSRDNREPRPKDASWKDTMDATPGQIVRLLVRFDGYRGKYAFHCHNLEHEYINDGQFRGGMRIGAWTVSSCRSC